MLIGVLRGANKGANRGLVGVKTKKGGDCHLFQAYEKFILYRHLDNINDS